MLWSSGAATYLSDGGHAVVFVALLSRPILHSTGQRVDVGYWSGHEDVQLAIGGASRTLWKTGGGLVSDDPEYVLGTTIRSHKVQMFGLSAQADDLLQAYEVRFAPTEVWQLMFTPGLEFKGERRIFKGEVDGAPQIIEPKGQSARLEITLASSARSGTKSISGRKSNLSFVQRAGDTSMEQSSLVDADGDIWGANG